MDSWDWKQHLGLLLAAASTVILMLRLLAISSYEPDTALAVLRATGGTDAIIGILIPAISVLIASGTMVPAFYLRVERMEKKSPTPDEQQSIRTLRIVLIVLYSLALLITPALLVVAMTAFVLDALFGSTNKPKVSLKKASASSMRAVGMRKRFAYMARGSRFVNKHTFTVIVMVLILASIIFTPSPWQPIEEVIFKDKQVKVGYVLESTPANFTILNKSSRQVEYFDPKMLAARRICSDVKREGGFVDIASERSFVAMLFFDAPRYPECRKA